MVKTFHDRDPGKSSPDGGGEPSPSPFTPRTFHGEEPSVPTPPQPPKPKALFPEAVQAEAVVDPSLRQQVEAASARLEMADFHFHDVEISRIQHLFQSIRLDDPMYITEFGGEVSKVSEQILDRLNEISHNGYLEAVKQQLVRILEITRKVNIDPSRNGFLAGIGALFTRQVNTRAGFVELERELSAAVAVCLEKLLLLKKSQGIFLDLFDKNEQQFRGITTLVIAGELRLETERAELDRLDNSPNQDVFARQSLVDRRETLTRFERRLHTLKILRHTVLLRMGQLRLEQKNMHTLIDQTDETINLLIPAWKQQVLALLSTAPNESTAALHERLAETQHLLTHKLNTLEQDTGRP